MDSRGLALTMTGFGASQPAGAEALGELLRRAKAGDLGAFEQLVIRHERLVFLTALRLLGRQEDAQDAAQEVLLRLYRHLGRFDEVRSFRPWLYRMTVNVCRDAHRRRRHVTTLSLEEAPPIADRLPGPEQIFAVDEQRRLVREGLRTLAEKERAALVLRDIEGLSTREVARILGSAEVTVRVQVAKARVKIKKFVEQFGKRSS